MSGGKKFWLGWLALLALQAMPARADDAVVFAADEADLQAFDQLLSEQEKGSRPAAAPFGQAVKEQAELLRAERPAGNAMGSWARDQRRKGGAAAGESASPGRSGEARSAVHGSSDSAKGSPGKSVGKGNKK